MLKRRNIERTILRMKSLRMKRMKRQQATDNHYVWKSDKDGLRLRPHSMKHLIDLNVELCPTSKQSAASEEKDEASEDLQRTRKMFALN